MKTLILFMLITPVIAQDFVSQIMEHNPFDPERGHKEAGVEETLVVLVPSDLPVCDGTLILGDLRYAMLTFMVDNEPVAKSLQQDEQAHGYKVKTIEYNQVILLQGKETHTIKLFFQEAKKDKRGGSRKALSRSKPRTKPRKKATGSSAKNKKGKDISKVARKVNKKRPPKIIKKSSKPARKKTQKIKF